MTEKIVSNKIDYSSNSKLVQDFLDNYSSENTKISYSSMLNHYRKFGNLQKRCEYDINHPSAYDFFLYAGLPIEKIVEYNLKFYGIHTMLELQNFPEPWNQEIYRRWKFKIENIDSYLETICNLEQHYGKATNGLDVTFDLDIAIWFAIHKFELKKGKGSFQEFSWNIEELPVVYVFVFEDPPLRKTEELITNIEEFNHIKPERILRQKCALPKFHIENINEAACDIHTIFYLLPDFKPDKRFDFEYLFPSPSQDKFYEKLLYLKNIEKENNVRFFNEIIEYY